VENYGETQENSHDFRKKPKIIEKEGFGTPLSTKEPLGEIDPDFLGP
jgi:hypothetical protein